MAINKTLKVGIVGCGAIGSFIALSIKRDFKNKLKVAALCDTDRLKAEALKEKLSPDIKILDLNRLIAKSDLIVEASSAAVSFDVAKKALLKRKSILCMSVGGLIDNFEILSKLSEKNKCRLYLPSGAICGLDGLKGAGAGEIYSVTLTTRKPPKGLKGAPYIIKKGIDLDSIKSETLIFEGKAIDAVKAFPQNVNVAATLSLCGIGAERTIVRVMTSPLYTKNTHEVEIKGEFGEIKTTSINVPSKDNPKTSALAMFSAVAKLKEITSFVNIGT